MKIYDPKTMSIPEVQRLLQGGIGPRPIALVSTLAADGTPNLSPFSFYNVFGANPPVVAFSPSRRGKDGTLKDTYNNLVETGECVISAVTYDMVEQVSLASVEFSPEEDEFIRSGLTKVESDLVRPYGVKESPYRMECKLLKMESFGEGGASANIAICEVVRFHVAEDILTNSLIDPHKIDLVARMGGDFYCRASGDAVFEVAKPVGKNCLGYDNLPAFMLSSTVYTGNDLGAFANSESIPSDGELTGVIEELLTGHPEESVLTVGFLQRAFRRNSLADVVQALYLSDEFNKLTTAKRKSFFEKAASLALKLKNLKVAWALALKVGKI
ncbi:MAG: flavin reductase [Ignavibacteriaceae bacterium]|nr:MAG: flavin reductase [Ignavibacteriaceae bacterium]